MTTTVIEMQSVSDDRPERRFAWVWIAVAVLLAIYALSQAPVRKIRHVAAGGTGTPICLIGEESTVYQPVNWLVTNTLMCYPLITWADMWGVKYGYELEMSVGGGVRAIDELE